MRIMSIGQTPYQTNRTNFNGLWGKDENQVISQSYYDAAQMCEMGTNHFSVTKTYYPFKDETEDQVKSVLRKHQTVQSHQFNTDYDQSETISEIKVKVMPKLDITEDQYNKYRNDDLLSKEENMVDDKLKLAGLKEHLLRNMRRRK